ncbi:MAG: InlB B-repeat-containing protein [Alphaproteobacteria bacterium]|nr:InlB B-repeat-containing protein [Alphaproteobacteria bacterium]
MANTCTANQITITYNGNTNTSGTAPTSHSCTYNGSCTLAANTFSKTTYSFNQWCSSAAGATPCFAAGANAHTLAQGGTNLTLYATWLPAQTTITLNWNDTNNTTQTIQCYFDGLTPCNDLPASASVTAPNGYSFIGWNTKDDGTGIDYVNGNTFPSGSSVTLLFAKWGKTINFDNNVATPFPSTKPCFHKGKISGPSISAITYTNFSNNGDNTWYPNNDGTGTPTIPATPGEVACDSVDAANTYRPRWQYNVSYDANGGTPAISTSIRTTCTKNSACPQLRQIQTITTPVMALTNFALDLANWGTTTTTGTTGVGLIPYTSTSFNSPTGNTTLYAVWIPCGLGKYMDDTHPNPTSCPPGHWCSNCKKYPCPAATTTVYKAGSSCSNTPNNVTDCSSYTDCALVDGSMICDSRNVCYRFDSSPLKIPPAGLPLYLTSNPNP